MSDNKLSSKTTSIAFRVPNELASSIAAKATARGTDRTSVMLEMLMGVPSVSVDQRATFPQMPALYLVWTANALLYIGQTECLRSEFRNHPRLIEFLNEDSKVAWFDPAACGSLEVSLDAGQSQTSRADLESQIADLASQVSMLQSQIVDRPLATQEPDSTPMATQEPQTDRVNCAPIILEAADSNGYTPKSTDSPISPLEPLETDRVKSVSEPLEPTERKDNPIGSVVPLAAQADLETPEFDLYALPLIKPYQERKGGYYFILGEACKDEPKLKTAISKQAKLRGFVSIKGTFGSEEKRIYHSSDFVTTDPSAAT